MFHLWQCFIDHIKDEGLSAVYNNDQCRPLIRCILALAYLPEDEVVSGFETIFEELNELIRADVIPQAMVLKMNGKNWVLILV